MVYTPIDYTLTVLYQYEDTSEAAPTYTETLNVDDAYSVSSPEIAGYTADQLVVEGTMPADDVTVTVVYTPIDYTLTVLYQYEDGTTAAPTYIAFVNEGEEYGVESPQVEGHTPDLTIVSGTMPTEDVQVTVIYAGTDGGGGGAAECAGRVIISEIAWAGTAADRDHQWIELRNLGSEPVDVTGWSLRWRKKQPVEPEDYEWKVVPLAGVLEGAYMTACEWDEREVEEPTVEFTRRDVDELSWEVVTRWEDDESYLSIQRKSDRAISNIDADILFDEVYPYRMPLSFEGDVVELLDAGGQIVDTANAFPSDVPDWPAGELVTYGTMERTDPLGPDAPYNWHTNVGVLTRGRDMTGRPLVASASLVNSEILREIDVFAQLNTVDVSAGAQLQVGLDPTDAPTWQPGWPWVRLTQFDENGEVIVHREPSHTLTGVDADGTRWILIETEGLSIGDYLFWVALDEGKTVLVPVRILSLTGA